MKKLTILVDCDDVMHYLCKVWVDYLNMVYGRDVDWHDVTQWELMPNFPGLSMEQIYTPLNEDEFWKHTEPVEGASEYIKKLIDDGHQIFVVTASTYHTIASKFTNCILRFFPYLTWDDIIVTSHKELVYGDVIIDDNDGNFGGKCSIKLLFDRPHNQGYHAEANGVKRVYDWKGIYEEISKIANTEEA